MVTLHALMARLPLATRADTLLGLARMAGRAPPSPTSGLRALPPLVTRQMTFPGDSLKLVFLRPRGHCLLQSEPFYLQSLCSPDPLFL